MDPNSWHECVIGSRVMPHIARVTLINSLDVTQITIPASSDTTYSNPADRVAMFRKVMVHSRSLNMLQ